MEFLLKLLTISVFAAESVLSPVPDNPVIQNNEKQITFAELLKSNQDVLGIESNTTFESESTKTAQIEPLTTANKEPPPETTTDIHLYSKKPKYRIAFLGDSMIDTLGDLAKTRNLLNEKYPDTVFELLNYGVGATNIEYGVKRITENYEYLGLKIPALVAQKPDIVFLESFGYNPFPRGIEELDRQWLSIAAAIQTLKNNITDVKIILMATIAPNSQVFAKGAPGINMDEIQRQAYTNTIKRYIENLIAYAKSQNYNLADVYHPSLTETGNGNPDYINTSDHIHYSPAGINLASKIIADSIIQNKILE
jgi:lysophospholipase L1-like esterase